MTSDIYAFDIKLNHIAKHVQLPVAPVLGDMSHLPPEERLPPLLIVNIQLPLYQVGAHWQIFLVCFGSTAVH